VHRDADSRTWAPLIPLFFLLSLAAVFEGFDTQLASLVLPQLGDEFDVGPEVLFPMLSVLSAGTVLGVALIPLADRWGRRPIFLFCFAGYALFTLGTAFATNPYVFAAIQFVAKILMVSQLSVAYVILSEEFPAHIRGRANGLMGAFASVGAALPAWFLAPLETTDFGWRGLFVMGSLPLLLLPLYLRKLPETKLFESLRGSGERVALRAVLRNLLGPRTRRRFVGITLFWFIINFWSAVAMFSFTFYVFNERGWTATDLQWVPLAAVPFAFMGYALAGVAMDTLGRRKAACLFLLAGTVAALCCYQSTDYWVIAASWTALQTLQGLWTIATTMTAELFATEVRASANALSHNLLGRWGMVLGPLAVGFLSGPMGSTANAVTLLAFANLLALPVIFLMIPETRGIELGPSAATEPG